MKHFIFDLGRGLAFLYRLNTLRLARIIFKGVNSSTVVKRNYFGKTLFLDVSRSSAQQLLWLQGERFVQERFLISRFVRPGMFIVDVGANIGYYALMFASFLRGDGKILCLEPDPMNLLELRANVAQNMLQKTFTVLPVAAGADNRTVKFEPGLNAHADPEGAIQVTVKKLDSLITTKVDFIKIDVEGYEGAVLDGALDTIAQSRPIIFLELHPHLLTPHTHRRIVQFFQQHYSRISAYQPTRGKLLRRVLQQYGCGDPVNEIKDLDQLVNAYESGAMLQTSWLICWSQSV